MDDMRISFTTSFFSLISCTWLSAISVSSARNEMFVRSAGNDSVANINFNSSGFMLPFIKALFIRSSITAMFSYISPLILSTNKCYWSANTAIFSGAIVQRIHLSSGFAPILQ